jgi:hypothetical protein
MLSAPAATVNVNVQAGVIGNAWDVQRAVTRAIAGARRLGRF